MTAEPVVSQYPSAYDNNETLFFPLQNTRILTVKKSVDVETLSVTVNENLTGLDGPFYIVFEGGEIWYVASGGVGQDAFNDWVISLQSHAEQRAMHGSQLQIHVPGEKIYLGILAQHVNMLKEVLFASQKYRFLVGLEANKPASPSVGERYLATDTKNIYYCFIAGAWVWINRTRHQDLLNLLDNAAHPQYVTSAEGDVLHDVIAGEHILNGDNHDHSRTNEGDAVRKIRAGTTASMGSPVTVGDVYFATDDAGGTLMVSADGVTWDKLGGVPTGAIAPFLIACPSGWTRYTALDGRFALGAATAGETGGNSTHTHTYTEILQHYHTLASQAVTLLTGGEHTHTINTKSGTGGLEAMSTYGGNSTVTTSNAGSHSHTVTVPAMVSASSGVTTPVTDAAEMQPPFQEVVFCQKS